MKGCGSARNRHCEVDGVTRCDKVGTDPGRRADATPNWKLRR